MVAPRKIVAKQLLPDEHHHNVYYWKQIKQISGLPNTIIKGERAICTMTSAGTEGVPKADCRATANLRRH
ncbi:hypothetical protein [Leeia oryzae]|uniref:hypothetical protein n=1 Tax=Leeia oryzae TaxID=356662 RepID=UPI000380959C|nr:hypothetical protein [Leeia oryzae]